MNGVDLNNAFIFVACHYHVEAVGHLTLGLMDDLVFCMSCSLYCGHFCLSLSLSL